MIRERAHIQDLVLKQGALRIEHFQKAEFAEFVTLLVTSKALLAAGNISLRNIADLVLYAADKAS